MPETSKQRLHLDHVARMTAGAELTPPQKGLADRVMQEAQRLEASFRGIVGDPAAAGDAAAVETACDLLEQATTEALKAVAKPAPDHATARARSLHQDPDDAPEPRHRPSR